MEAVLAKLEVLSQRTGTETRCPRKIFESGISRTWAGSVSARTKSHGGRGRSYVGCSPRSLCTCKHLPDCHDVETAELVSPTMFCYQSVFGSGSEFQLMRCSNMVAEKTWTSGVRLYFTQSQ